MEQNSQDFIKAEYERLDALEIRQHVHRTFTAPLDDVEGFALAAAEPARCASVLDVGPGTGSFVQRLRDQGHCGRLAAVDISEAAVRHVAAVPAASAVLGDACALPFRAGSFDVVFARHMLYHVSNLDFALHEAARVVAARGRYVALVNTSRQIPRLNALIADVVFEFGFTPTSPTPVHSDSLGRDLARYFEHVHPIAFNAELRFTQPEELVRFAISLLTFFGVTRHAERFALVCDALAKRIASWFMQYGGPWVDPKGYVAFVAERPYL